MSDFAITVVPAEAALQAQARKALITHLRSSVLLEGHDFGTIPGTAKPTLYKAGAERLCAALELSPIFEITNRIEVWDEATAMFHYETLCRLVHIPSGREVATAMGSCNSLESRYRWRWVAEADVPHWLELSKLKTRMSGVFEFDFAIRKRETTGQYGKPAEYWAMFDEAIENKTARRMTRKTKKGESEGWEIGGIEYRIPNDEIFSLTNTILKMSNKRAFVSAVLIASNASEFFTVDMEDLHADGLAAYGASPVTVERPAAEPVPQPTAALIDAPADGEERVVHITDVKRIQQGWAMKGNDEQGRRLAVRGLKSRKLLGAMEGAADAWDKTLNAETKLDEIVSVYARWKDKEWRFVEAVGGGYYGAVDNQVIGYTGVEDYIEERGN